MIRSLANRVVPNSMMPNRKPNFLVNALAILVLFFYELPGLFFLILPVIIFKKLRQIGAGYLAATFITTSAWLCMAAVLHNFGPRDTLESSTSAIKSK